MSSTSSDSISICANCSKGGEGDNDIQLKTCTGCKMVKYCSRECQIAHRPQHKKECKKRAAQLHDEKLFKQPPREEDCPICFIRMPSLSSGHKYQTCCGKVVCIGCYYALSGDINGLCPFCRTPAPAIQDDIFERNYKRIEMNDPEAHYNLGFVYYNGKYDLPINHTKALELWHRAGELGCALAYQSIGSAYYTGVGVRKDMKKAQHYFELAAMRGHVKARHNVGSIENDAGNMDRALKHWIMAAGLGNIGSLTSIKHMFIRGQATKVDYNTALKAHQAYLDEIRSDQRDEAAAYSDDFKYY